MSATIRKSMRAAKILIVEDEAIVALDLRLQLGELGYTVSGVAASGDEALAMVAQDLPELILMDIRIRGALDGVETARAIRERHEEVPVIFLTAHSDPASIQRAASVAAYGFLTKPYQLRELTAGIEVALAKAGVEHRLRASERLLDRAGRLAGVGGFSLDLRTQALYWSAQTCRIHDLEPGHQPGTEEALDYFEPGPSREAMAGAVQAAIDHGKAYDLELPLRTARGRPVWVRTIGEVDIEKGRAVRLFGAVQDISARRAMEQALERTNAQLRSLYEHTPALLLSVDSAGTIVACSDLLLQRASHQRTDLVGRPLALLLEGAPSPERALAQLFASGHCERVPFRLVCGDGRRLDVFMSALVEEGPPTGQRRALAAFEDVTETVARTAELRREHQLRVQIERHAEELAALLAERNEMLNVLAHEVRQPLNNASAALQSVDAQLSGRGEGGAAEPLRRAQEVLRKVMAGVDNTLAVSALLVGSGEVEPVDVDIDMLLGIVIADMHVRDRERVRIERLSPVRTAWVDAGLLRLALRNLLANALAFSPPPAAVVLRLAEDDAGSGLTIDVIDTGPGIPAHLQPRLFQRGARGPTGTRDSHGLGLYIVRRAMELQGGGVSLLATGAQGTVMRLHIREG